MATPESATALVGRELRADGQVWVLTLNAPKGNVLDTPMVRALTEAVRTAASDPGVKGLVFQGAGNHFSFGASVPEHLPEAVGAMLPTFHALFHAILDTSLPTIAAVRGCCLGGGLELAAFCHRLIATPDSTLGQPEIALGVFAPVASALLPHRIGRAAAADLCLSGRRITGTEAHAMGLADQLADDPLDAALSYATEQWLPHSASSLRFATRALNLGFQEAFCSDLAVLEALYLDHLMATHDAGEGISAFIEHRPPHWSNA